MVHHICRTHSGHRRNRPSVQVHLKEIVRGQFSNRLSDGVRHTPRRAEDRIARRQCELHQSCSRGFSRSEMLMKSKRNCRTDRRPRSRQGKLQSTQSLIEKLDSRVYMCTDPVGDKPFGDAPWLTSAVTL